VQSAQSGFVQVVAIKLEESQKLLTVDQVAERVGQSRWSIYRKVAAGQLPAIRLGQGRAALRISEAELDRWLYGDEGDGQPTGGTP
jgi:excisionase family DNA binding protein